MIKTVITAILCFAIFVLGVLFLSCEKNYITQVPEENIPEYHMTYCYVRHSETGPNYVITINTNTQEVIDSVEYFNNPYNELKYIDGGNTALKLGYQTVYLEDVLTNDTLALVNKEHYHLFVSANEAYFASDGGRIFIYSLPDLYLVDSVDNSDLLPLGIDGENNILYAFNRDTSLIYSIDFSESPSETTIVDILYWKPNPNRRIGNGFLSPDNNTLLLICEEVYGTYKFLEYDADSFYYISEIPNKYLVAPEWSSDGMTCFGINEGSVVKYNMQTKIYSTVINKNNIFTPDYHWDLGEGFNAMDLQLTPDDKYLYIQLPPNCGGPCLGFGGHTLVYDLNLQEFVYRYDYSDYLVNGNGIMRLNPKDWSN